MFKEVKSYQIAIVKDLFSRPEPCEYDMGGDDDLCKLQWCQKIRKHVTVMLGNQNIEGRAVMFAKNTVLPILRNLKGSFRNDTGVEKA